MAVNLELAPHEAHVLLGSLNRERLTAAHLAAKAKDATQREYQQVVADVLGRIESGIVDQLLPSCLFMHEDEPCGKDAAGEVDGKALCRFHRDLLTTYPVAAA